MREQETTEEFEVGAGQLWTILGFAAIGLIVYVYVVTITYKSLYKKVGPNEALVISGGRGGFITTDTGERIRIGYRIVKGGGSLVNPLTERAEVLSLEVVKCAVDAEVRTEDGITVKVDADAQVKVKGDEESIGVAAEHFLSDYESKIRSISCDVILGHLRATLKTLSSGADFAERDAIAGKVAQGATDELSKMGLELLSLNVRELGSFQGAIASAGSPAVQ